MNADDVLTSGGRHPERVANWPPTKEIVENATELAKRVSAVLALFGKSRKVTSGYRPAAVNAEIAGAAKKSNHMTGRAVDIEDGDRMLTKWCQDNMSRLVIIGLWIEDARDTPSWVHFQMVPPASGRRIFRA